MFHKEDRFQETPIGNLPADWESVKLGELGDLQYGYTTSTVKEDNGTKFLRITDINEDGSINWKQVPYCHIDSGEFPKYALQKGDILFARIGATAGKTAIVRDNIKGIFASYLIRLKIQKQDVFPEFAFYETQSETYWSQARRQREGQLKKGINATMLSDFMLPLPPFKEQRAIVGVLGVVDSAIEYADRAVVKTERLKRGLMQQLLTLGIGHTETKQTPIGNIPKNWEVTTIDKECLVGTGGTPSRNIAEYYGGKISWVKSTEVDYGIISKTEETITEEGVQNSNAKVYPAGSLVMALYGQGTTRGKCAILGIDAAVNQACAVLQSKGQIHIPYLFYWCQKSYSAIRGFSQGANQANLNMGIIRSLSIPLPPLSEQKKITEILSIVDSKLNIEKSEKEKTKRIKQGLMDLLLTGKIRIKVD